MASRLRGGAVRKPVPRWAWWVMCAFWLVLSGVFVSDGITAVAQSVPSTERVKSFVVPCKGVMNLDCTNEIQWQFSAFAANPQIRIHQRELVVTPSGMMVLMVFYTEVSSKP